MLKLFQFPSAFQSLPPRFTTQYLANVLLYQLNRFCECKKIKCLIMKWQRMILVTTPFHLKKELKTRFRNTCRVFVLISQLQLINRSDINEITYSKSIF